MILSLLSVFFSTLLFSQVYKLESVFTDRIQMTNLSYWKPLEGKTGKEMPDTFALWGYHLYHDDWNTGPYEVEYFKGNAAAMHHLLQAIDAFAEKYENEDKVLTTIAGVRVKTLNQMRFKYTLVFDKENKVVCKFTRKQWRKILTDFEAFCKTNHISYDGG